MRGHLLSFVLRVLIGAPLLWAGVTKLAAPRSAAMPGGAATSIYERIMPASSSARIALAGAEALLGAVVVMRALPRAAVTAAILAYLVFTALVAAELMRPEPIPCGCFGPAANASSSGTGDNVTAPARGPSPTSVRAGLVISLVRNVSLIGVSTWWLVVFSSLAAREPRAGRIAETATCDDEASADDRARDAARQ